MGGGHLPSGFVALFRPRPNGQFLVLGWSERLPGWLMHFLAQSMSKNKQERVAFYLELYI